VKAHPLSCSDADLRLAAAALAVGDLVAFPTETVYGLGADAFNPVALARVFEAKRRPSFDPLIVHIADLAELALVADLGALDGQAAARARLLSERLWPGPLTLILPKRPAVPDLATSGLPTVAVRFPAHPVARRIIELAGRPIAAPSANPFGYLSPTRAEHVREQLGDRVDYIVDGGPCSVGVESTVLDLCTEPPAILRPGGTERERIEALIGPVATRTGTSALPTAPGQLASHYAPRAQLTLYPRGGLAGRAFGPADAVVFFDPPAREAWLRNAGPAGTQAGPTLAVLSPTGSCLEAAAALFELLHRLDAAGCERINVERGPDAGLCVAVNDRLARAAARERFSPR